MEIINATSNNVDQFALCGIKDKDHEGYQKKLKWIKHELHQGLKCKFLLDEVGKTVGGLEYTLGLNAWRPVQADKYMFIHCINIQKSYKYKGWGTRMVSECIDEARMADLRGVAVVARKGNWMAGPQLFMKMGFNIVEEVNNDYILLAYGFKDEFPVPFFYKNWNQWAAKYGEGLTIVTSDQCPYASKSASIVAELCEKKLNIKPTVVHIDHTANIKWIPCGFGVFCIINNGKVIADHPISASQFINKMKVPGELTHK